jgi:hypothetical protein
MTAYYVSSKLKHADMWKASDLAIVSTWPYTHERIRGQKALSRMWDIYLRQIKTCEAFVLYLEPGETPKGCLIEMGVAMVHSKPIFIIWEGDLAQLEDKLGTAIHHESVSIVHCIEEVPL